MRRDVNSRGTRPPIPLHLAPRAVCVCRLIMQLWLLMNRASNNESINTVHFVAPMSLDSTVIVIRERLHSFHEMRIQFDGSLG